LIEARAFDYGVLKGSYRKSLETIQNLLKYYPSEVYGKVLLGGIYRNLEEWDEAETVFQEVAERRPTTHVVLNLVFINIALGKYGEAQLILEKYREIFDATSYFERFMARLYMYRGNYPGALEFINEAQSKDPGRRANDEVKGNIFHVQGKFSEARKCYERLIGDENPSWQNAGILWLSRLYLLRGQYEGCKEAVERGIKIAKERQREADQTEFLIFSTFLNLLAGDPRGAIRDGQAALHVSREICYPQSIYYRAFTLNLIGRARLELMDMVKAKEMAGKLKKWVEQSGSPNVIRLYYHLIGLIQIKQSKFEEGIANFKQALSLTPHQVNDLDVHSYYLASLADAYYLKGDLPNAYKEYKRIVNLNQDRLLYGSIYAISHFRLGVICGQLKGFEQESLEHYRAFLKLWDSSGSDFLPFETIKDEARKGINQMLSRHN